MITLRQWHSYIALFVAPSVLFFALTGALQLFSLHEAHGQYHPPVLLEKFSSVHKDQVFARGDHHEHAGDEPAEQPAPEAAGVEARSEKMTQLLKIFFLLVALSLIVSTSLGLWIGLTQTRHKRTAWFLVSAGTLIPCALLVL